MIPFTLAKEIRATILDYLVTTFHFKELEVERSLLAFLEQKEAGLFKGPTCTCICLSVKLIPKTMMKDFIVAKIAWNALRFPGIRMIH